MSKDKRMIIYVGLLFNKSTEVFHIDGSLPCVIGHTDAKPDFSVFFNDDNYAVGDVVFDDINKGINFKVVLLFADPDNIASSTPLEGSDSEDSVSFQHKIEYRSLFKSEIQYPNDYEDFGVMLATTLGNTVFNPVQLKPGYCYENLSTHEVFYVINSIKNTSGGANFLVLESTFVDEPIILPADAFHGMPMKWVAHLRYNEVNNSTDLSFVEKAKRFFINAHSMTNHRYSGKPYSFHLGKVVDEHHTFKYLVPEEDHDQVEAELWGHDSIEDARLTFNNVKDVLGQKTAEGCFCMSEDTGRNRKERHSDAYYGRLNSDLYGEYKKLCDRLANVRNSVETGHSMGSGYAKELASFEKRLRINGDTYADMWNELFGLLNKLTEAKAEVV